MKYSDLVYKYGMVMLFGILVFYIDETDFFDYKITLGLIALLALIKSILFIYFSYNKIIHITINDVPYHAYIRFMLVNIFLVILSFSVDFMCLYKVDNHSFTGLSHFKFSRLELIFEFWYFSVLNFSFFGYGYVMPVTIASKFVVVLEVLLSFSTIFFILSDFISLKESLQEKMRKKGVMDKK